MDDKIVATNFRQKLGLWVLNQLSPRRHYSLKKDICFGSEDRNFLDFYQTSCRDNSQVAGRRPMDGLPTDGCPADGRPADGRPADGRPADGRPTDGRPTEGRPLVLFFYGGNWCHGKKEDYRFVAAALCGQGFDVVIPDYRLYPEVRFDAIIKDAVGATDWVLNQEQPVIVMGHSAGAQLGSLICLNRGLNVKQGSSLQIKGFVGLSGPYDFYPFSDDAHYELFGPEECYALSQPVNFVREDGPPMYLLHGKDDQRVRRGQSKSLMEKVRSAGGSARREVYESMGHVDMILSFAPLFRWKSSVIDDVVKFIREHTG